MPMDLEQIKNTVINGDNIAVMRTMPDNCIDSIITDPPYGLKFMGKKWDYDVPGVETWQECLRVLKPGGTLLCFAGSRTQHRMVVNIEDAGFIIKDTLMWLYGKGFPKSTNISKSIEKKAGKKRKVIEAELWSGWHSHGLKPAYEPILVCAKPNDGSYVDNALKWGVAGLNIDECRVPAEDMQELEKARSHFETLCNDLTNTGHGFNNCKKNIRNHNVGRFPANIILECTCDTVDIGGLNNINSGSYEDTVVRHTDPNCPCYILDEQSGISGSENSRIVNHGGHQDKYVGEKIIEPVTTRTYSGFGGASRFFYVAKASKSERNYGCDNIENQLARILIPNNRTDSPMVENKNIHPTLKPVKLMEYLCRLTKTPTGGIVLDPFSGSGTTGIACILTGRDYVLIEQSAEYCNIAEARLKAWKIKNNTEAGKSPKKKKTIITRKTNKPKDPKDPEPEVKTLWDLL